MRGRVARGIWLAAFAALAEAAEEGEPKRRILGSFGAVMPSEYTFQGIVFEKKGVIVQPYGRITLTLCESLDVFGGFYLSIHDEHTDAGIANPPGTPKRRRAFYEADWLAGATAKHGRWSLSSMYWDMTSPSDAFETARAVESILAFADAGLWREGFALDPYLNVYVETDGKSGTGVDEGWYLQPGLKPNHATEALGHPLTISLPASIGFGFDDFYAGDEAWGYVSTGVALGAPLAPIVPHELGVWTVTPAFAYWRVNEDVQYIDAGPDRYVWSLTLHVDF